MDHMRIWGTEPSSVNLGQRSLKYENDAKKCQNKVQPKKDGVINPQYNNFNESKIR